jgi:hypothetical protein
VNRAYRSAERFICPECGSPLAHVRHGKDGSSVKRCVGERSEIAAALVAMAEAGPPDELRRARIDLLHAQLAFVQSRGNEATPLLLAAAHRLEKLDITSRNQLSRVPASRLTVA